MKKEENSHKPQHFSATEEELVVVSGFDLLPKPNFNLILIT